MLNAFTPTPTLAVSDLGRATAFYDDLGFQRGEATPDGVMFSAGQGGFLVYQSQYAGTNKATAMMFEVPGGEFEAVLTHLRGKGLQFQTFEFEGATWDGDVLVFQGMRNAWFADPDGNIINVMTRAA